VLVGTVLAGLATVSLSAQAEEKFETMEGLKGKDYGKQRQKYVKPGADYPKYT
jgi:hypothetical protein